MIFSKQRTQIARERAQRFADLEQIEYLVTEVGVWLERLQVAIVDLRTHDETRRFGHDR